VLIFALVVLLAATACTSSAPASPSSAGASGAAAGRTPAASPSATATGPIVPTRSTLHWHACSGETAEQGIHDCTTLSVPLNYADPGGRHITLALDMIPATAPASEQQGIMLVNPGGPGASGLSLPAEVSGGLTPSVARDYDIVGFDPRGVGSSRPALSCEPGFFSGPRPDYVPANAAAEQQLVSRAQIYAADCEQKYGWLLPYLTTQNMARDLDSIRAAFGVSKINYLAFSYGTYLGEVYATLFPGHVRRMVLDSTVDPTGVWYADNLNQDLAFQSRLDAFFAWVARYPDSYDLGTTQAQVRAAYSRARSQLQARPAGGIVGADELDDTYLQAGYNDEFWPGLAQALSSYLHSADASDLVSQYQSYGHQDENEFAVYNAVECADVSWPRDFATWTTDTVRVAKTAPFYAWGNTWYNAACAFWPVRGPARPLQVKPAGLPGVLMLQGTGDPATPYAGAQKAHQALPSARMVVVTGSGNHGQSFAQPSNDCVQGYLNRYLASGDLPPGAGSVNATCAAEPDPGPGN